MPDPLLDARAIEAAAEAIHGGKGCTCRHGAKGDARLAVTAYLRALPVEEDATLGATVDDLGSGVGRA